MERAGLEKEFARGIALRTGLNFILQGAWERGRDFIYILAETKLHDSSCPYASHTIQDDGNRRPL
jgi:hypothetical protein